MGKVAELGETSVTGVQLYAACINPLKAPGMDFIADNKLFHSGLSGIHYGK